MNSYKLRYYNSGGYKSSIIIETPHTIIRDSDDKLQMLNHVGEVVGDVETIEQLLNDTQGWIEDCCVFDVETVET